MNPSADTPAVAGTIGPVDTMPKGRKLWTMQYFRIFKGEDRGAALAEIGAQQRQGVPRLIVADWYDDAIACLRDNEIGGIADGKQVVDIIPHSCVFNATPPLLVA